MSSISEKTLLDAITASPDEDAPRLAYADWLEERGDPRGEFIRLQCAVAKMDRYDEETFALRRRVYAILKEHHEEWTKKLIDLDNGGESSTGSPYKFVRGMIAEFAIHHRGVFPEKAEEIFRLAPALQRIFFCLLLPFGDFVVDADALASTPWLGRLRQIAFQHSEFSDKEMKKLAASPYVSQLKYLSFTQQDISHATARDLSSLKRFSSLETFGLMMGKMESGALRTLLCGEGAARWKKLFLGGVISQEMTEELSDGLANLEALEMIDLCYNRLHGNVLAMFARLPSLSKLEFVRLRGSPLPEDRMDWRGVDLPEANIKAADFTYARMNAEEAASIISSPMFCRLEEVKLTENKFDETGGKRIAAALSNRPIKRLELDNTGLVSRGIRALAESPDLNGLRALRVCHNEIKDAGLEAIARSDHFSQLTILDLRDNPISSRGVNAIIRSEKLPNLLAVKVSHDDVSEKTLKALRERFPYSEDWE